MQAMRWLRLTCLGTWSCIACSAAEPTDGALDGEGSTGSAPVGSSVGTTTGVMESSSGDNKDDGTTSGSDSGDATSGTTDDSVDVDSTDTGEVGACVFFLDDFSTGDTSHSDNGFAWLNPNFAVSEGFGHGDSHALRFSFGPDASGEDSTSELRFELGREVDALWVSMAIYYPDGTEDLGSAAYEHRDDVSSDNNKFIRLWSGDYNSEPKVGASTRPSTADGVQSGLTNEFRPLGSGMGNYGSGNTAWVSDGEPGTCTRGSWCTVQMEFRLGDVSESNGVGESNGIARWWIDGTLVYDHVELANAAGSQAENYLDRGYLQGWANSGFSDLTYVYIDDVAFCDSDPGW